MTCRFLRRYLCQVQFVISLICSQSWAGTWSPELEIQAVSSSNPLRLYQGPASSYVFANPSLVCRTPLSDTLHFHSQSDLITRYYPDSRFQGNGGIFQIQQIIALQKFVSPEFDLGFLFGGNRSEAREIGFVLNETAGRPLRSEALKIESNGFYRTPQQKAGFRLVAEQTKYQDQITDEAGNLFLDDNQSIQVKFESEQTFQNRWVLNGKLSALERKYIFRRARFTEGSLNTTAEQLKENQIQGDVTSGFQLDGFKFLIELGAALNKDRIQGALDYDRLSHQITVGVPLKSLIFTELTYRKELDQYRNFVGRVLIDPTDPEKRRDLHEIFSMKVKTTFGKNELSAVFEKDFVSTNYTPSDIDEIKTQLIFKRTF